jgi:hypothetical protein
MRRLKFFLVLATVLAAGTAALFRYPAPWSGGPELARDLILLAVLAWVLLGLGRALFKLFGLYASSVQEELCFCFGLGLAGLSAASALLGALGLLKHGVAALLLAAFGFAFSEHLEHFLLAGRRLLPNPWNRGPAPARGGGPEGPGLWTTASLGLASLSVLALALVPPTFYDSLLYHLALPLAWEKTGRSLAEPSNLFSALPSAGELNTAFCLLLEGPLLATLLNLACGLVLALSLAEAARRWVPGGKPWLAPALCLTQPLAALAFGLLSSDGLASLHSFLSLDAFLHSLGERNRRFQKGWLAVAALLGGAAVADKPVAILPLASLALLAAGQALKERSLRSVSLWAGMACLAALPLLPWLGRCLGSAQGLLHSLANPLYLAHLRAYGMEGGAWWRGSLLPFRLTYDAGAFGNGGQLSPLFLGLAPALAFVELGREGKALRWYLGLGLLAWAFSAQVLRYLIPFLPGAALLAAMLAAQVREKAASRGWSLSWDAVLGFFLLAAACQTAVVVAKDFDPFPAALGLAAPCRPRFSTAILLPTG